MDYSIQTLDGRQLSYAEYGNIQGSPIFFFHGTPSSRYLRHPYDGLTKSLGVRLITIDRPGYGLSDFQPNRTLLDWPSDVEALADFLRIERFAVAGISGGGPYASACAYKLPHRVMKAGIISGGGPTDSDEFLKDMYPERKLGVWLARSAPWTLRPLVWLTQNPQRNPERFFQNIYKKSSKSDQDILGRPEIKALLKKSWAESAHLGIRGFVQDGIIFSHPWGFDLKDIQIKVHMWHGDSDTSIPLATAKYIADQIPDCKLNILPGKGHFFLFDIWEEVLTTLIS